MNGANFQKWLTEKLIPNLPPRSVIVVDNASYHNLQEDKCPTQSTRKGEVIAWMDRQGIKHSANMIKGELLEQCKRYKHAPKYILDETLKQHGHECLRLPQYHAELNAIELIWSQVKGRVAAKNASFRMVDVIKLTQDAINGIGKTEWEDCCRHVRDEETRFANQDVAVERAIERFLVDVSDAEETATGSEADDYSDTDSAFEFC